MKTKAKQQRKPTKMAEYLFSLSNIAAKVQKSFIKRSTLVPVWNVT